jgi:hypothetical protein
VSRNDFDSYEIVKINLNPQKIYLCLQYMNINAIELFKIEKNAFGKYLSRLEYIFMLLRVVISKFTRKDNDNLH